MPRIDPIQLLKCLSVLLSSNGGIKSKDEVQRLASLMTKFSKKLVSKCIYIQILKCTETELLGLFMGSGGWRLAHMWLTESIVAKNWPLVRELLELLLLCPVDIERLKTNNCPKLVKELSKDGSLAAIRALAAKLVEQWLKTVKGENVIPVSILDIPQIITDANASVAEDSHSLVNLKEDIDTNNIKNEDECKESLCNNIEASVIGKVDETEIKQDVTGKKEGESSKEETLPILKISLKDGKQVISKVEESEIKKTELDVSSEKEKEHKSSKEKSKSKDKDGKSKDKDGKSKDKDGKSSSSKSSSRHSSSSRSHSSSKSLSNDKHRSSSSSNKNSSSSSSSKDKSRDKSKDSSHRSSDKHNDKKHSAKSSSSNSDKSKDEKTRSEKSHKNDRHKDEKAHRSSKDHQSSKESQKSKDSLDKLQPPSIHKLGKIPKLTETQKKDAPSISIEARKPNDPNRPKTVKTFHSKFRSHGLEEEAKPPPPRGSVVKKPSPLIPPTVSIPKRQSPSHNMDAPPEKKTKIIEAPEKPGSIKLIPAKPKPVMLLESDMFMDALNASATNKKEPKKRKRRTSGSKDGNPTTEASPPNTPTASSASPNRETKSTPFKFYQDTLEAEENKEKDKKEMDVNEDENAVKPESASPSQEKPDEDDKNDENETHVRTSADGLRGVLCYHKKKGPKRSIKWKPDTELEEIQYFELDETERVNVTKTFMDMKNLERVHERESFQKARNLINDDVMEEKTVWRPLIPIDSGSALFVDYGKHSKEKEIQAARQKSVLQSLYFHKSMIPDSPSDPEPETHSHTEPTLIPLDDVTGNTDNISDFRNTPWPEPKGSGSVLAVAPNNLNMPQMFPSMAQFPAPFPNPQYNMPGFQGAGPGMVPPPGGDWQNAIPPNIMGPGGMPPGVMGPAPGPMPPGMMNPANMPPGLMMPPDGSMMNPDMFGPPGQMFPGPMPPEGFNMIDNMNGPQNMYPPGFPVNMPVGPCPPGGDNSGPFSYGNRGGMRGRDAINQWHGKGGNWEGPIRGRGGNNQGRGGNTQGGWKKAKCIHFMKRGTCRQGDSCPYLHPGVNCPY